MVPLSCDYLHARVGPPARRPGQLGQRLEAGHAVLSGSITKAVDIEAGDTVVADFPGFGSVRATFF
ncbi:hypothetical protein [Phytohabitans suffuscus]|uniref:Fumarylacetoacetase-like C-terminal domain-containing protein n=1 Tax=Phytohabitans suffuscus TaxID=624315 RepID=A0A6F8YVK8_9ACTN|nr:hypothetical protein [Phytohabitans suffuscus]BCB90094.1 hypothetical protein Psuf_074070 [Phytohabitans suffuscus]